MSRRRLLAALSVALLLAVAGCAGISGDDSTTGADDAETLQNRTLERLENVETYTFEGTTTSTAGNTTVETQTEGAFDTSARRARMDISISADGPYGSNNETIEMNVLNDTVYVSPAGHDGWRAVDASEMPGLGSSDPIEDHGLELQRVLLDGAEVRIVGNETVDGRSTVLLEVEPTDEALETYLQRIGGGSRDRTIENATLTQWVTDDGYVVRSEAEMTLSVGRQTANVTTTAEFDDFNESVDIEPPEDVHEGEQA